MNNKEELEDLKDIFFSALDRADPYKMLINNLKIKKNIFQIHFENEHKEFDLSNFDQIYVLGAGKATAKMAKAIEEIFGTKLTGGIISVKYGHTEKLNIIDIIESGHPIPDENSIIAGKKMIQVAKKFTKKTLIINLISGGGSALLESLLEYKSENEEINLTLEDLQKTTKTLLECGATIEEINCIRKHISAIKGGRFAGILYPATLISFILSDVVGDKFDSIASGLTTFDRSSFHGASNIIQKYEINNKLPSSVVKIIKYGAEDKIEDTLKEGDKAFSKVHNILIGTNYNSILAASYKAKKLGYNIIILSSQLFGEAKELAKVLIAIAKDIKMHEYSKLPVCIIGGGETTVTVKGKGKGGRNQEMALSFLSEINKDKELCKDIYFLSASTDGSDGPTDAAGAFASLEFLDDSLKKNLNIEEYLKNNDSYNFFARINGLFKIGPTNTNVCDIQIVIIKKI
jgi:glycerate 2-kinase